MILIISHNSIDEPTNDVIDWLRFYKADYKRINGDDFDTLNEYSIGLEPIGIRFDDTEINANDVSIVWYRRWLNRPLNTIINEFEKNNLTNYEGYFLEAYVSYLRSEISGISPSLFSLFNDVKWIPDYKLARGQLNKLETLKVAKKLGLSVPSTIITTSKKELQSFYNKNGNLITKSIKDADLLSFKEEELDLYTKVVTSIEIEEMPDLFFPTLFQEMIDKEFEIRTFFIENEFYSMAIFSQNDESTSVDFRNYNRKKPNRYIPFKLPEVIELKLNNLMKTIGLNTGSIDILVPKDTEEYYFLEVNPVGQIGMVSNNCNYNLEEIIAEKLIKHDEARKIHN